MLSLKNNAETIFIGVGGANLYSSIAETEGVKNLFTRPKWQKGV